MPRKTRQIGTDPPLGSLEWQVKKSQAATARLTAIGLILTAVGLFINSELAKPVLSVLGTKLQNALFTSSGSVQVTPTATAADCDLDQIHFPCWYAVQAEDTSLYHIARKFSDGSAEGSVGEYVKRICNENAKMLEQHFRDDLTKEQQHRFSSRCNYLAIGWKLLIPAP